MRETKNTPSETIRKIVAKVFSDLDWLFTESKTEKTRNIINGPHKSPFI